MKRCLYGFQLCDLATEGCFLQMGARNWRELRELGAQAQECDHRLRPLPDMVYWSLPPESQLRYDESEKRYKSV